MSRHHHWSERRRLPRKGQERWSRSSLSQGADSKGTLIVSLAGRGGKWWGACRAHDINARIIQSLRLRFMASSISDLPAHCRHGWPVFLIEAISYSGMVCLSYQVACSTRRIAEGNARVQAFSVYINVIWTRSGIDRPMLLQGSKSQSVELNPEPNRRLAASNIQLF